MKDYSTLDGMIANQSNVLQTAFDKGFKQGYEEGREKNLTQLRDEEYKNGFEAGQIIGKDIGRAEVWKAIMKSALTDIGKAVMNLIEEYGIAKDSGYVRKPISYALYQTWRRWDEKEKPRATGK